MMQLSVGAFVGALVAQPQQCKFKFSFLEGRQQFLGVAEPRVGFSARKKKRKETKQK